MTATVYAAGVDGANLYVYGSSGDDTITVHSTTSTLVSVGGSAVPIVLGLLADSAEASSFTVPDAGKIVVAAGDGTNHVAVTGAVSSDLRGGAGADYLRGGSGNDTLSGFAGADVFDGGAGNDTIDGGPTRTGWSAGRARTSSAAARAATG